MRERVYFHLGEYWLKTTGFTKKQNDRIAVMITQNNAIAIFPIVSGSKNRIGVLR
nr:MULTISPECIES: hypothetical protein [Providencia]